MYEPTAQSLAPGTPYPDLAQLVAARRLSLCIGAGTSRAEPTGLPLGSELAPRLFDALVALSREVRPCDPGNLLAVADAYEQVVGIVSLQTTALDQADFLGAVPAFAHRAIAELTRESELVLLSLNWDNCVERSSEGVVPRVEAVSDIQGLQAQQGPSILKIHGCATRPTSVLLTSSQLMAPGFWVNQAVGGQLAANTMVFVGMADVPDYVRPQVKEMVDAVGNADRIFVVAPGIVDSWASSAWASLLPGLPIANRLDTTADAFTDGLLRAYMNVALAGIRVRASEISADLRIRLEALSGWILNADALEIARWLRRRSAMWPRGIPYLTSPPVAQSVLALASQGAIPADPFDEDADLVRLGPRTVLCIITNGRAASQVAIEAERRVELLRNQGRATGVIEILSSGHLGPLPSTRLVGDVVGALGASSIVAVQRSDGVVYRSAAQLLEAPAG